MAQVKKQSWPCILGIDMEDHEGAKEGRLPVFLWLNYAHGAYNLVPRHAISLSPLSLKDIPPPRFFFFFFKSSTTQRILKCLRWEAFWKPNRCESLGSYDKLYTLFSFNEQRSVSYNVRNQSRILICFLICENTLHTHAIFLCFTNSAMKRCNSTSIQKEKNTMF